MKRVPISLILASTVLYLAGCSKSEDAQAPKNQGASSKNGEHIHEDGSSHDDHADEGHTDGEEHGHDEVSLGTVKIGDTEAELAQGHGKIEAGKEGHLVVKLPYNDKGATMVRAWIGTDDRTRSFVGKGEYAASHDDYDVHATAPDSLPDDVKWWIEIETPDGTKAVGSAQPLLD
jgi:hypothetical protein